MINLDSIKLQNINKPARYVGGEVNQVIKNSNIQNSIVLCYLNVYEKAMSSYYINLLYNNINLINNMWCKRCFAPDLDFEEFLIKNKLELYSLEDFKSIKENNILLFVVDNELDFTNFFNMLNLANIKIDKEERDQNSPKVVLVPTNNVNIKPIVKYADYVFYGDSNKEKIQKVLSFVRHSTDKNLKEELQNIETITSEYKDEKIMQIENGIIPSIKINNSSIIIDFDFMDEIDEILEYINKSIKAKGINTVSFLNYEKINQYKFCEYVYKIKANIDGIRIACKNIDFNRFEPDVLDVLLPCIEQNSVKFNVTTCSTNLIKKINIGTDKDNLVQRLLKVFKNNRNSIKLKFTIGLPEETYEDIDNMFEILEEIVSMYSQNKAKDKFSMKVEIDYYIPSEAKNTNIKNYMNNITKLETKIRYILEKKHDYCINLEVKNLDSYITRIILTNKNIDISEIIYDAYKLGARFNLDSNKYNKSAWEEALFNKMKM